MSDKAVRKALADIESALEVLKGHHSQADVTEKPKAAKASPKVKAESKVKAAKAPTSLKEHAKAALEAKKFHHKSKEYATIKAYIDSKTRPTNEVAAQVSSLLGLPSKAAPKAAAKAPKAAKVKAAKAPKAAAQGGSLKAQAQAALDSGKAKGKDAEVLQTFLKSKNDGRSAEGREEANAARAVLGLPLAKKPGPAPKAKAEAKAEKAAKAKPDVPKAAAKKAPKAAAPANPLKVQAAEAIEAKKFHHKSKEHGVLSAFLTSKLDGRSAEGKAEAAAVREILGLPPAKKTGPAKKAKESPSGKGEADAASEVPKPSPTKKSPGAKPRAIEAVEAVLASGTMNAAAVLKALTDKGWLPDSQDPKTYVSFILSQNKDKFERDPAKPRGYYRLVGSGGTSAPAEAPTPAPAETPPEPQTNGNGKAHAAPEKEPEDFPTAAETGDDDDNPFDDSVLS